MNKNRKNDLKISHNKNVKPLKMEEYKNLKIETIYIILKHIGALGTTIVKKHLLFIPHIQNITGLSTKISYEISTLKINIYKLS